MNERLPQKINDGSADAVGPEKLFKVERVHLDDRFVAHGNRGRSCTVTAHAQEGAGGDDVVAPVGFEEFERGSRFGTRLDFVQHDDGFPGYELYVRTQDGGEFQRERIGVERSGEDRAVRRIFKEVDVSDIVVIGTGKLQDGKGLAALTAPLEDEGEALRIGLPAAEQLIDFSGKNRR